MLGISTAIFHLCCTLSPTIGAALMKNYGFYTIGAVGSVVSSIALILSMIKKEEKQKTS